MIHGGFNMFYFIYVIGFLAQLLFSARLLLQWILSERAHKVVSPSIFWTLSLIAAYLLFIYGWLRDDFAIILGQLISYYIYIWNLNKKDIWKKIPFFFRYVLILTPVLAIAYICENTLQFIHQFFKNDNIPLWLLILGSLGQIVFTLRFVYQWLYSRTREESVLPMGFWIISLAGSILIVIYALIRLDPVLILGQSMGLLVYGRNIYLSYRENKYRTAQA